MIGHIHMVAMVTYLLSVPPPPLQPKYLQSYSDKSYVTYSFKLHAASNRNGPIRHYQLVIIPRGNHEIIPINNYPNIFLTKSPPQDKAVAIKLPNPRPYIASDFTGKEFPDVVTLISPEWNATKIAKKGERMIRVLWAGLYVSVCLRAFVESTDKKVSLNGWF
jgi:Zn-dependent protease with chaperone function